LIASRVVLHLAAAVLPVLATVLVCQAFGMSVKDFGGAAFAAVLAAQVAALIGWPILVRNPGSAWLAPLATGLLMAVITHLLFGPAFALVILVSQNGAGNTDFFAGLFGLSRYAAAFVGWASAPLVMATCVLVHRLRRKELARAVAT
jgi:hypothetical protein